MRTGDTIAAIASPRGRAARAIVRLSGPDTPRALDVILWEPAPFARGARSVRLRFGEGTLPALLVAYEAPRSYTGEHGAELLVVGNPLVAERVLEGVLAIEGVRAAEPGEFTARAYLNGRLTLREAEGVAAVIAASSESQRRAADLLLRGETGDAMRAWADRVATLLALAEAGIDFTDQEDVVPIGAGDLASALGALLASMRARVGAPPAREASSRVPRVALVGPPNAGKSTLFNALLGRARSVVSERAGTTRDAIAEPCDLTRLAGPLPGGAPALVELVDLAGIDDALRAQGTVDALAQRAAAEVIERADALVLCDPSGRFERAAWASAIPSGTPTVRVRTKADLLAPGAARDGLAVCAIDGVNLAPLASAIVDAAFRGASWEGDLIPRHAAAVARAIDALTRAHDMAQGADDPNRLDDAELVADALREALDALGEVVGEISPDEVLGRIFRSFCVGK